MGFTVDVTGEVFRRPTESKQHLLEIAALARVNDHRVLIDSRPHQRSYLLAAQYLDEDGAIEGVQHQSVRGMSKKLKSPVARHRLGDVNEQRVGNWIAGIAQQDINDLLGVVPCRAGIPQRKRRDAVGVHVLRCPLKFGKRSNGVPTFLRQCVVDLQQ